MCTCRKFQFQSRESHNRADPRFLRTAAISLVRQNGQHRVLSGSEKRASMSIKAGEYRCKTPVAFLVFNRPDTTKKVFSEIARAKPEKLFVVADGPRHERAGEAERCEAVRKVIAGIDWSCDLYTNYSDANVGCRDRVSSGIDWVFRHVEQAIFLEDDCLPHPSFFRF